MRRLLARAAVVAGAVALVVSTQVGIAHAASEMCSVDGAWWLPKTCSTDSVSAHPTGHWVDFYIDPFPGCQFDWMVIDSDNGSLVGSGRSGDRPGTIFGLYGSYHLHLSRVGGGCGGEGVIENELP